MLTGNPKGNISLPTFMGVAIKRGYVMRYNNDNNNNFILCMPELDSLPRKIAGKPVVVGQDRYMNNISTKNKNLKLLQSLAGCNLK